MVVVLKLLFYIVSLCRSEIRVTTFKGKPDSHPNPILLLHAATCYLSRSECFATAATKLESWCRNRNIDSAHSKDILNKSIGVGLRLGRTWICVCGLFAVTNGDEMSVKELDFRNFICTFLFSRRFLFKSTNKLFVIIYLLYLYLYCS